MIGSMLLMLAGLQAAGPDTPPDPPREKLICRYDPPIALFFSGRRMCLTAAEWEQRAKEGEAASHMMLREYLGNTECLNGGVCAQF